MPEEWFSLETIRRIHPLHAVAYLNLHGVDWGIDAALSFIDHTTHILYNKRQFNKRAEWAFNKILSNPDWLEAHDKNLVAKMKPYRLAAEKILQTDLSRQSNQELVKLFKQYYKAYEGSHQSGQIINLIEFEHEYLTNHVKGILEKQLKKKKMKIGVGGAFNLVSLPEKSTQMQQQEADFSKLTIEVLKNKKLKKIFREKNVSVLEQNLHTLAPAFNERLDAHYEKYLWLPFMYEGPAWQKSYFLNLLSSQARQNASVKELEKALKENKKLLKKKKALWRKLGLKGKDARFAKFIATSIYLKGIRKENMYFACYVSAKLFKEIGKRLNLSLDQVRYFLPTELEKALIKGKYSPDLLNQRIKFSVYRILDKQIEFLTGDHAKRFYYSVYKEKKYSAIKELKGSSAFPGSAKGTVKVINHPNEMFSMNDGDIMVSHSTNPNLVPAMKKASAIITDIGGITCHAAIVSRELKKPCVIGTKIATHVLRDGDKVKVDASKGIVRKVKK